MYAYKAIGDMASSYLECLLNAFSNPDTLWSSITDEHLKQSKAITTLKKWLNTYI